MASIDRKGPTLEIAFDEHEAITLRRAVHQVWAMLRNPTSEGPAMQRLFPDAYEDPNDAMVFHEMIDPDLGSSMASDLEVMKAGLPKGGGPVRTSISLEQAESWLRGLTDIRLTIGARLGVDEAAMEADLDPNDPDAASKALLHWLGWVQGSLLEAMRR